MRKRYFVRFRRFGKWRYVGIYALEEARQIRDDQVKRGHQAQVVPEEKVPPEWK